MTDSSNSVVWSFPTRVVSGEGAAVQCANEAHQLGGTRVVVVSDRGIEAAGLRIRYRTYFNTILLPVVSLIRLLRRWQRPARAEQQGKVSSGEDVPSDFSMTKPGRLNDILTRIFSLEALWIRRHSFPVGVSLLCLAQKPYTNRQVRDRNNC